MFLLYRLKVPNLIVKYYDSMYSLWRYLNAHFVSRRGRILLTYLLTPTSEGCRPVQFRGPLGCAHPWHDSATSAQHATSATRDDDSDTYMHVLE